MAELKDARDSRRFGSGEYVFKVTSYAEDGTMIATSEEAWPGGGLVLLPASLDAHLGRPVHAIRVEPMFRPDGLS